MLLGANNNLENKVILALTKQGELTADQIRKQVTREGVPVSLQAVYLTLSKLQREGVLVKKGRQYSIRIAWLLDMSFLVNEMEQTFLQQKYIQTLLPMNEGDKRQWRFTSLHKMNDFWSQVLLAMAYASGGTIMYDYNPHLWFHLMQTEQEYQYLKAQFSAIKYGYTLVGSKSFLDSMIVKKYWHFDNAECHLISPEEAPFKNMSMYIQAFGNLFLTVKLDVKSVERIEKLFSTVKSQTDLETSQIMSIFHEKVKVKMMIEYNSKKALTFKKKFRKIFGIREIV